MTMLQTYYIRISHSLKKKEIIVLCKNEYIVRSFPVLNQGNNCILNPSPDGRVCNNKLVYFTTLIQAVTEE